MFNYQNVYESLRYRGSVVVKALCNKPEGHSSRPDEVNAFFFSIYLTLSGPLGPGIYSTFNRYVYQKQKNVSGE
jgi:hypothetical protein